MVDHTLIDTLVGSIVTAFFFGLIAKKLKLPTILGYIVAGIVIGPYTPGFVADIHLAKQLAEIGIILLMFGVGLHFSFRDLVHVRKVAIPGAFFQMMSATAIGGALAYYMGCGWISALIFGLSLSVASTIVLLRALEQRNAITSEAGRIAVGWLIIEDIMMVLVLVLLPVLADMAEAPENLSLLSVLGDITEVVLKIGFFFAFMLIVGRRVLPWLLVMIAKTRSRELNTLGMLVIALGMAYFAYAVFDASFALGAFLAGLVLNESDIGKKASEQSMAMRDTFSVLFFVSVGMLFDPMTLVDHPVLVTMTLLIIVVGKSLAALLITRIFKQTREVSYTIALSLAQIGEFSFILGGVALTKGLIDEHLYHLILAGALLSIALNPFLFRLLDAIRK